MDFGVGLACPLFERVSQSDPDWWYKHRLTDCQEESGSNLKRAQNAETQPVASNWSKQWLVQLFQVRLVTADKRGGSQTGRWRGGIIARIFVEEFCKGKDSLDVVVILFSGNFGPCFELVLAFIMLTYCTYYSSWYRFESNKIRWN